MFRMRSWHLLLTAGFDGKANVVLWCFMKISMRVLINNLEMMWGFDSFKFETRVEGKNLTEGKYDRNGITRRLPICSTSSAVFLPPQQEKEYDHRDTTLVNQYLRNLKVGANLIENDCDTPPVAAAVVELSTNNLWCHILACSNNRTGQSPISLAISPIKKSVRLGNLRVF